MDCLVFFYNRSLFSFHGSNFVSNLLQNTDASNFGSLNYLQFLWGHLFVFVLSYSCLQSPQVSDIPLLSVHG